MLAKRKDQICLLLYIFQFFCDLVKVINALSKKKKKVTFEEFTVYITKLTFNLMTSRPLSELEQT